MGAPRLKKEERKIHHYKIRFNDEEKKRFEIMKEANESSGSELIRDALEYYAERVLKI